MVLRNRLGASGDALRAALAITLELELVIRNPGYGHPLRPEYLLTATGLPVAGGAACYVSAVADAGAEAVGFRKWTVPLLLTMQQGNERYSSIQQALDGITPRALTGALRSLNCAGLVDRQIDDGYPPRAAYRLSNTGARLSSAALQLARVLARKSG